MKLLKDIQIENYNNIGLVLEYLRNNSEIGDENVEPIENFHCFWKGELSELHLMCLQSLYQTHPNCKVFFWTPSLIEIQMSPIWPRIERLFKDNIALQEVKYEYFEQAKIPIFYSKYLMLSQGKSLQYNHDVAYASDIVRFVVLYIFGGLWFDMDILFLRNFNSIKLKRYLSQWSQGKIGIANNDYCGNGAILRLEKNHDLIQKFINYPRPFYPNTCFQLSNDIDLTMLPCAFFDILWHTDIKSYNIPDRDEFLTLSELNLPAEIYAYHWHNNWNKKPPPFFKFIV